MKPVTERQPSAVRLIRVTFGRVPGNVLPPVVPFSLFFATQLTALQSSNCNIRPLRG